jgi:signal transduction histidine kinase
MCADLTDIGGSVTFLDSPKLNAVCRPNDIRRASRNLVENALRYGTNARVAVVSKENGITITVDDDGPGLKADEIVRVFDPFVRLASTRNDAAGYGLGLNLARTVARNHGGDITLANREGGGLRAALAISRA